MEKIIHKFTKGKQTDYESLMTEDYDHIEVNEHEK
jgi:hypothetical protein